MIERVLLAIFGDLGGPLEPYEKAILGALRSCFVFLLCLLIFIVSAAITGCL